MFTKKGFENMSVEKARNNYIGKGCTRKNCAQSVSDAFKETFDLENEMIDSMESCGTGRAPGGVCGAYYAGKRIAERQDKQNALEFEKYFREQAGALECKTIRGLRKLPCVGCVEKSSEFLEKISKDRMVVDNNPARVLELARK
ncbi:C-GCAxxG-C-C family protein [Desulfitobacterium metallireducens]|nr:C-GCAxxG-C-C family protein [Desulfitobacterium metallireducens]